MSLQRGFDRRLNLLPQLLPNGLQAFVDLLPQLLSNRVQCLLHLLEEILPNWLQGQDHLLPQLIPDRLQGLIDLLLQLLPHRPKNLVHLLEHGVRYLALDLLQDGVDSLGHLFFEHGAKIHLRARSLAVLRRTWLVWLVPARRRVLPSLLALLVARRRVLPSLLARLIDRRLLPPCSGVVLVMLSIGRPLVFLIGLSAGVARGIMVRFIRASTARTRLGGLRALLLRLV